MMEAKEDGLICCCDNLDVVNTCRLQKLLSFHIHHLVGANNSNTLVYMYSHGFN
jgi:hypothetical protein